MKKMFRLVFLALSLTLVFSVNALAGPVLDRIINKGELKVGMSIDFPPLHAKAKDGKIIGLDADLARAMAVAMGVEIKIVPMPFYDLLQALEAGKVDMVVSGMTITPKRNLKVAFVGPYFISGQSILAKHETVVKLKQPDAAKELEFTLAVPKGSTSETIAKAVLPKAQVRVAETMDLALDMVLTGKTDAMMADQPYCVIADFRNKDKDLEVSERFTFEPLGVALQANDPHLINWLENFFLTMTGNGELEKMTKFWFTNPSWIKELP